EQQYNLAYFFVKRIESARETPKAHLPYGDDGASRASTPSPTTYLNSLRPLDYQQYDVPTSSEQNDDLLFERQTDLLNQTQQIHKELRGGFKSFGKALRGVFGKKKEMKMLNEYKKKPFDHKDRWIETAQTTTTAKLPILKTREWKLFQNQEVQTTTNAEGTSTTLIPGRVTANEKVQKKNDVKARSILVVLEDFWRNKPDLDTISFDDLYKTILRLLEQEVKRTASSINANTQVSPASTPVSIASTQISTANLSDATVYAFLVSQLNGSQLVHEDLEQIHEDDLEEMDLKWQLALLSMRTRREYRGHRNQDNMNKNQDNSRRTWKKLLPKPWWLLMDLELVSEDKLEKKIVFPTVAKIEFVRPKQQEKPIRKPVKYAEMYSGHSTKRRSRLIVDSGVKPHDGNGPSSRL
ncbi:hypothetical protein Tco_0472309, partial [Tanacetum coccineum]